jgi:C-terminal processing protease CtpA/Prc
MVVRAERGMKYPVVSKITPDGAAAENLTIRVGDEVLQVDGVSCAGKRAEVLHCLVLPDLWAVFAFLRKCTLIRRL